MKVFVILLACFFIVDGFGFEIRNSPRLKRQTTKCNIAEQPCRSGNCIHEEYFCDGKEDCSDGSDEESCESITCPPYTFRCAYGACLNPELRCDGVIHCKDNSDENSCGVNRVKRSPIIQEGIPTGNNCILPQHPEHGKWIALHSATLQPGEVVGNNTVLAFTCDENYKLVPDVTLSLCLPDWTIVPQCIKTCPSLSQSEHLNVSCTKNFMATSCENPVEGTKAILKCDDIYESDASYCRNGSWGDSYPSCKPVCGIINNDTETKISSRPVKRTKYPWHVALYKKDVYICGGTLISPKLILTGAHCLKFAGKETLQLGVGKYYREYNDTRDDQAQFPKVAEILIHEDFNDGKPFFAFDLGVIVLENPIRITKYVVPVCLDLTNFDLSELIGHVGNMVGWGQSLQENNKYDLKNLDVDYKTKKTCELPENFIQYYIPYARDKICASVRKEGAFACLGILGGGLVFPDDSGKYFLRGIISVAPKGCGDADFSKTILSTSIQYHIKYIEEIRNKYR